MCLDQIRFHGLIDSDNWFIAFKVLFETLKSATRIAVMEIIKFLYSFCSTQTVWSSLFKGCDSRLVRFVLKLFSIT